MAMGRPRGQEKLCLTELCGTACEEICCPRRNLGLGKIGEGEAGENREALGDVNLSRTGLLPTSPEHRSRQVACQAIIEGRPASLTNTQ